MAADSETPQKLPKLVFAAAIIAFLVAASNLIGASHQIIFVFSALIPAVAGITILRKRVWGAYGYALYLLATATIIPLLLLRDSTAPQGLIIGVMIFGVALAALFFFAGRSLAAAGAKRGLVFPWIAVSCLFTMPFLFFRAFVIPTGAMEDTLLIGDRIVVRTFPRVTPSRGDMIAFHYPVDRRQLFIKRVIGVPGDRIRIVSRVVYRNGAALTETYAVHKFPEDKNRDDFPGSLDDFAMQHAIYDETFNAKKDMLQNHVSNGEAVVPAGKYFVLGDNRDNSLDSRYWGFVSASDIIGKPVFIYSSEQAANNSGLTPASTRRIRWNRIFKLL